MELFFVLARQSINANGNFSIIKFYILNENFSITIVAVKSPIRPVLLFRNLTMIHRAYFAFRINFFFQAHNWEIPAAVCTCKHYSVCEYCPLLFPLLVSPAKPFYCCFLPMIFRQTSTLTAPKGVHALYIFFYYIFFYIGPLVKLLACR